MSARCPYCRDGFEAEEPAQACPSCQTPHHRSCWEENGGCTVFGCTAGPAVEEKIRITVGELGTPFLPPAAGVAGGAAGPGWAVAAGPGKSRVSYILLGVFLGAFGAHNFYAGYKGRGAAQLAITVCTLLLGSWVSWLWAMVEVCTVEHDSRGVEMA